jgi:hypothetical protein
VDPVHHLGQGPGEVGQHGRLSGLIPNKKGWELLQAENPDEAKRQGMTKLTESNAMDMIRNGRIKYRQLPVQQSLETGTTSGPNTRAPEIAGRAWRHAPPRSTPRPTLRPD